MSGGHFIVSLFLLIFIYDPLRVIKILSGIFTGLEIWIKFMQHIFRLFLLTLNFHLSFIFMFSRGKQDLLEKCAKVSN